MAQQLNQFRQSVELGMIALEAIEGRTIEVKIDSSVEGEVKAGDVVVLSSTSEGSDIMVVKKSAATDIGLGVVAYNFKKTSYKAGDYCEVFVDGKVVFGKIGEAVDAGNELTWDATDGFKKKTSTNNVDAIALDKAGIGVGRVIVKSIM